jgi:hypothetical protein
MCCYEVHNRYEDRARIVVWYEPIDQKPSSFTSDEFENMWLSYVFTYFSYLLLAISLPLKINYCLVLSVGFKVEANLHSSINGDPFLKVRFWGYDSLLFLLTWIYPEGFDAHS